MTHALAKRKRVASLYTDEDVGSNLVAALRHISHDVLRTVDAGQSGAEDAAQLAYAARNGMILITHNLHHFRSLNPIWRHWQSLGLPSHPGVLAVPQPGSARPEFSPAVAARLIDEFLTAGEPLDDAFYRWHPIHGWTQ